MTSPGTVDPYQHGVDRLGSAIDGYAADATALEHAEIGGLALIECVRSAQNTVWSNFCERSMAARQRLFSTVETVLSDFPPQEMTFADSTIHGKWRFSTIRKTSSNASVELVTIVNTQTRWRHVHTDLLYAKEIRAIPTDKIKYSRLSSALKRALHHAAVAKIYLLDATVDASIPGSRTPPEPIAGTTIMTAWHDMDEGRPMWLRNQNAGLLVGDGDAKIDYMKLMQFLEVHAKENDGNYVALAAIADVLMNSTSV